jgi:biotin/methionine sulfoxide reductase
VEQEIIIKQENIIEGCKIRIEFINVSPLKSDFIDEVKSEWIAARPNTDTALMLGIAHTLHVEGLSE